MESLEIAHKLLQLITRTLIQMITLNHKVSNPLLSLSCLFFSLLVYRLVRLCACKNAQSLCALCACVSTMGRRVVEGPEVCHTPENGQGQSSISDPSSSPSSFTLCCHGMSRWVTVSLATGCFLRSEGDAGRLVDGGGRGWGRGGVVVVGRNSLMSYTSRVNNFQPLLTTCLFFWFVFFCPPLAPPPTHASC